MLLLLFIVRSPSHHYFSVKENDPFGNSWFHFLGVKLIVGAVISDLSRSTMMLRFCVCCYYQPTIQFRFCFKCLVADVCSGCLVTPKHISWQAMEFISVQCEDRCCGKQYQQYYLRSASSATVSADV